MQPIKVRPQIWSIALLFVASSLLLSACASPLQAIMGGVVTQEIEFDNFQAVEVNDAFHVEIRQGDEYRVSIEIDEATLPYLEVNTSGDTLQIGLRPRLDFFLWNFNSTLRAEITMPTLVGVTAHDASHVNVSGFNTDGEATFEVSDASSLKGEINTGDTWLSAHDASKIVLEGNRGDVEIEVNDASHVTLIGEGQNAKIRAANASHVDLSDFAVEDAEIEVHDASNVTIDVSGTLDAEASNASHISYYGNPTIGELHNSDASAIDARER